MGSNKLRVVIEFKRMEAKMGYAAKVFSDSDVHQVINSAFNAFISLSEGDVKASAKILVSDAYSDNATGALIYNPQSINPGNVVIKSWNGQTITNSDWSFLVNQAVGWLNGTIPVPAGGLGPSSPVYLSANQAYFARLTYTNPYKDPGTISIVYPGF